MIFAAIDPWAWVGFIGGLAGFIVGVTALVVTRGRE